MDVVKRSESGMITDPLTVNPDATLADLDKLCGKFHISGLPVVDHDNKLVGIITNRDMRFIASEDYDHLRVKDVMTKENLVTGPSDISKKDAHDLLAKNKIEKLPLVDGEDHLTGLITVKDFVKTEQYPDATKDDQDACASPPALATSATHGSVPPRSWRPASMCSWSTPPTARRRSRST